MGKKNKREDYELYKMSNVVNGDQEQLNTQLMAVAHRTEAALFRCFEGMACTVRSDADFSRIHRRGQMSGDVTSRRARGLSLSISESSRKQHHPSSLSSSSAARRPLLHHASVACDAFENKPTFASK